MNFKKHKGLIIAGGIILVFLLGSLALLRSSWAKYNRSKGELQKLIRNLDKLQKRSPFPSQANVDAERENLMQTAEALMVLNNALRSGQVEPQKMESAEFMPLLERTLGSLSERFRLADIDIPPGFLFGFERYAREGTLPEDAHIPGLVQQLRIMEQLCNIVIDSKISSLQSIVRDEFEDKPDSGSEGLPDRSVRDPRRSAAQTQQPATLSDFELYSRPTHFTLAFKARESSSFDVINRLAADPMFCVISYVELDNERQNVPDIKASPALDEAGKVSEVIIGREEVLVKLELDIYRFAPVWNKLEQLKGISFAELEKRLEASAKAESERQEETEVPDEPVSGPTEDDAAGLDASAETADVVEQVSVETIVISGEEPEQGSLPGDEPAEQKPVEDETADQDSPAENTGQEPAEEESAGEEQGQSEKAEKPAEDAPEEDKPDEANIDS